MAVVPLVTKLTPLAQLAVVVVLALALAVQMAADRARFRRTRRGLVSGSAHTRREDQLALTTALVHVQRRQVRRQARG